MFGAIISGALASDFLAKVTDFQMKFFGFGLDLGLDEIMEDFWVNRRFDIDSHCSVLCGSAIENCFKFFGHGAFAGNGVMGHDLAGPTFNE